MKGKSPNIKYSGDLEYIVYNCCLVLHTLSDHLTVLPKVVCCIFLLLMLTVFSAFNSLKLNEEIIDGGNGYGGGAMLIMPYGIFIIW